MQIRFPKEPEAWNNYVEKLLTELGVDYARMWQVLCPVPDPEAGLPFAGPLAPEHFTYFPQEGSGSRSASIVTGGGVTGLSGTTAGCTDYVLVTIDGAAAGTNCADCSPLNGTHVLGLYATGGGCLYRKTVVMCGSGGILSASNIAGGAHTVNFSMGSQAAGWRGSWPGPGQSAVFSWDGGSTYDYCVLPATVAVQSP